MSINYLKNFFQVTKCNWYAYLKNQTKHWSNMAFLVPAASKMNIPFVEICPSSQNIYVILTFYQFYLENYFFPCNLFKDVILSFRDINEFFLYKYWPKNYCVKKYIFYKVILKMRQPSTRKIFNSIDLCIFASFAYLIHCLFIHSTHIYWSPTTGQMSCRH